MTSASAISYQQHSLASFDRADVDEALRSSTLRTRLLGGGKFTFTHRRLAIEGLTLDSAIQTSPLLVDGCVSRGHVMFGVSLHNDDSLRLNGQALVEGDVQVYTERSDMFLRSPPDWHWVGLQLPRDRFESVAANCIGAAIEPRGSAARNFSVSPGERLALRTAIESTFAHGARCQPGAGSASAAELGEYIIGAFIRAIGTAMPANVRDHALRARRAALLRRAEGFLTDRPARAFSSAALCAQINLGERAVEKLFRDAHGLTPREWHLVHRLNGARDELMRGHGAEIAAVAARWGFNQPGRFAVRYRRIFGETPRSTLQARK